MCVIFQSLDADHQYKMSGLEGVNGMKGDSKVPKGNYKVGSLLIRLGHYFFKVEIRKKADI